MSQSGQEADYTPFLFQAKYYDREMRLFYYGFRYYSPATCKWLNRDPLEEDGGYNLYAFVNNDPINGIDYLGMDSIEIDYDLNLVYWKTDNGAVVILGRLGTLLRPAKQPEKGILTDGVEVVNQYVYFNKNFRPLKTMRLGDLFEMAQHNARHSHASKNLNTFDLREFVFHQLTLNIAQPAPSKASRQLGNRLIAGGSLIIDGVIVFGSAGFGLSAPIFVDEIQANARQLWTGETTKTFLQLGGEELSGACGANKQQKEVIGLLTRVTGNFAGGAHAVTHGKPLIKPTFLTKTRTLAQRVADKLRRLPAAKRPNTVAVIKTKDGKIIMGVNQGGVENDLLANITPNKFNGECAEINAIARAKQLKESGIPINLRNAEISVAHIRGPNSTSGVHGTPKTPCDVCKKVIKAYGIKYKK